MSDIFISYKSEDRERIQILVKALEAKGWSVWWDPAILDGETFRRTISKALDDAKCAIVVWSNKSVESQWVIDEADEGKRQNKLVPILIDDVEIPIGFRQIQTAKLINWQGESSHPEFEKLIRSIANKLGKSPEPIPNQKTDVSKQKNEKLQSTKWLKFAVTAGIIALIIASLVGDDEQKKTLWWLSVS